MLLLLLLLSVDNCHSGKVANYNLNDTSALETSSTCITSKHQTAQQASAALG